MGMCPQGAKNFKVSVYNNGIFVLCFLPPPTPLLPLVEEPGSCVIRALTNAQPYFVLLRYDLCVAQMYKVIRLTKNIFPE